MISGGTQQGVDQGAFCCWFGCSYCWRLDAIYALNIAGAWAILRVGSGDAKELVALNPDAILAGVGATTPPLLQATRVVPIVFAQGVDPVGNQYVDSLSRPGATLPVLFSLTTD